MIKLEYVVFCSSLSVLVLMSGTFSAISGVTIFPSLSNGRFCAGRLPAAKMLFYVSRCCDALLFCCFATEKALRPLLRSDASRHAPAENICVPAAVS
ncbi:MAG: hypothetical protein ACLSHR_11585 [Oscillospiraceae bacterium]